MSDSAKALLAAMAMRAKKNAIDQGKGLSVTAKVKALSEAGFTDAEIDKILAVDTAQLTTSQDERTDSIEEYNEQVDETLNYGKSHIALMIITIVGSFVIIFWPSSNVKDVLFPAMLWAGTGFTIMLLRAIPFAFKKADYFLKR